MARAGSSKETGALQSLYETQVMANGHKYRIAARLITPGTLIVREKLLREIDHSCSPNAEYSWTTPAITELRALRDIAKGELITASYIDPYQTRASRHTSLNFDCGCEVCALPEELVSQSDQNRANLALAFAKLRAFRQRHFGDCEVMVISPKSVLDISTDPELEEVYHAARTSIPIAFEEGLCDSRLSLAHEVLSQVAIAPSGGGRKAARKQKIEFGRSHGILSLAFLTCSLGLHHPLRVGIGQLLLAKAGHPPTDSAAVKLPLEYETKWRIELARRLLGQSPSWWAFTPLTAAYEGRSFAPGHSALAGEGTIARKDYAPGELIMSEPALFVLDPGTPTIDEEALLADARTWNPAQIKALFETAARRISKRECPLRSVDAITSCIRAGDDRLLRLLKHMFRHRCFIPLGTPPISYLVLTAAVLNHDCNPNATAHWDDYHERFVVRALKSIQEGEEITISYINPVQDAAQRQQQLSFICKCRSCKHACGQCTCPVEATDEGFCPLADLREGAVIELLSLLNLCETFRAQLPADLSTFTAGHWSRIYAITTTSGLLSIFPRLQYCLETLYGQNFPSEVAVVFEVLYLINYSIYNVTGDVTARREAMSATRLEWQTWARNYRYNDRRANRALQQSLRLMQGNEAGSRPFLVDFKRVKELQEREDWVEEEDVSADADEVEDAGEADFADADADGQEKHLDEEQGGEDKCEEVGRTGVCSRVVEADGTTNQEALAATSES